MPTKSASRKRTTALLVKDSPAPLYEQLEDLLRHRIATGQLKPGDRFPSEYELVDAFQISRMTVRRALDRLALDGLIVRRPGKGAFVSRGKLDVNPTTAFSFSIAMQALGHRVGTRVIEQRIMVSPLDVARDLGLAEGAPVILINRVRYVDDQAAVIAKSYLPTQVYEGILNKDLRTTPLSQLMEQVSGLSIARTEDSFESALIRYDEAGLLSVRENSPVLLVRGVAYTASGLAVRSTKSVYRGDLFRFQVKPESGLSVQFNR
ncbi:MAG: GntR family transcriptional regulator [Thermoflexales bacterium]